MPAPGMRAGAMSIQEIHHVYHSPTSPRLRRAGRPVRLFPCPRRRGAGRAGVLLQEEDVQRLRAGDGVLRPVLRPLPGRADPPVLPRLPPQAVHTAVPAAVPAAVPEAVRPGL